MGFSSIASDDASIGSNILEQTTCIKIFEDMVGVYAIYNSSSPQNIIETNTCTIQKEIVDKIKCRLSDRAANMKLFN